MEAEQPSWCNFPIEKKKLYLHTLNKLMFMNYKHYEERECLK